MISFSAFRRKSLKTAAFAAAFSIAAAFTADALLCAEPAKAQAPSKIPVVQTATDVATITIGDAQLRFRHGTPEKPLFKPYVDILTTPAGRNILQDAPRDHIHHHGLMFAIKIDGVNFWEEFRNGKPGRETFLRESLTTATADPTPTTAAARGELGCRLEWRDFSGKHLANETRTIALRAGVVPDATLTEWTSEFSPTPERKKVTTLGGNFYHGLGLRFDQSLTKSKARFFAAPDAKKPEDGLYDRVAEKLTETRWIACVGELHGKPVTVAMFDCPKNHRPMLAYSCANKHMTYLSATTNLWRQPLKLQPSEKAVFRYAVCIWEGTKNTEEIEQAHGLWLKSKKHQEVVTK
ncbi:MAG: PmoA family protein [Puniceicoccales bacterium]|jgi:hypothetical protein|nr:PmoA family protein [Puniceicoccales bacterium]